jgi:hypothetical protein
VPPALIVHADGTSDPAALTPALDLARSVGGVGRVLLFHPPELESDLATRAFGYRLWPLAGDTPGRRFAGAFDQAAALGYEGAVVVPVATAGELTPEVISGAVGAIAEHQGAIAAATDGSIALLALPDPQPTLFPNDAMATFDELTTRAEQQRIRLRRLPEHQRA